MERTIRCMLRPLYREKCPRYRRLWAPEPVWTLWRIEKYFPLPEIEPRLLDRPIRSLITTTTELIARSSVPVNEALRHIRVQYMHKSHNVFSETIVGIKAMRSKCYLWDLRFSRRWLKIVIIFWDVTPCSVVEAYRRFRTLKDGSWTFLRNKHLPDYVALHPRTVTCSQENLTCQQHEAVNRPLHFSWAEIALNWSQQRIPCSSYEFHSKCWSRWRGNQWNH
jgi:hypothetical protein